MIGSLLVAVSVSGCDGNFSFNFSPPGKPVLLTAKWIGTNPTFASTAGGFKVTGKLTDKTTGAPLQGRQILLWASKIYDPATATGVPSDLDPAGIKQATTDQNGDYSIKLSYKEDVYHYYAVDSPADSDLSTGYASALIIAPGYHQIQENIYNLKATVNSLNSAFTPGTKSGTLTILNSAELLL